MSKQPRDDANAPIPVLALRPNGGQSIAISSSSARSAAVHSSVRVITVYATVDAFIEVGDSDVVASASTSHFLPAGLPYDISLGAETRPSDNPRYVACIQASDSGVLYVFDRDWETM